MNSIKTINICVDDNAVPVITLAGRFNINDCNFTPCYCHSYTSIHLYFYNATVRIANDEFKVSPGDITITPPGAESRYDLPEPGMHFCAHFVLPANGENMWPLPVYLPGESRSADTGFLFEEIIEFYRLETRLAKRAANEALRLLLLHLALRSRTGSVNAAKMTNKLDAVRRLIESNPEREYSTISLGKRVNLSPNYLAKVFQHEYGMTIKRYQLTAQIEKAAFLLKFSNLSIKETGVMVGLSDPQYFNKRFRSVKGVSPTAFRNQA